MRGSGFDGGLRGVKTDPPVELEWEMRPGGMLVQRRLLDPGAQPPPMIRLRICYGESKFEVSVGPRATFSKFLCLRVPANYDLLFLAKINTLIGWKSNNSLNAQ
ncbi:BAG family molecular chaperone regulator 3 [Dendrobium catenatum]|uniref:BAG family molecular chaperone regulator 3 n=1 Tax=Dendrobium catenatum TaxID=906689 RepID=A0A2I0XGZ0_9ASPA|nr:BAG family molecular chaperone regulator 3 [Dendrobium catenatum]